MVDAVSELSRFDPEAERGGGRGQPPLVDIAGAMQGHGVAVRVSDSLSGVDLRAVSVSFGDGQVASGRKLFHHRYAHAGVYTITVRARDKIGNAETVHRLVSVR
jgi:hypothetical protein